MYLDSYKNNSFIYFEGYSLGLKGKTRLERYVKQTLQSRNFQ